MTTQTQKEKRSSSFCWDYDQTMAMFAKSRSDAKPTTLLDWAVRGCFAVGVVGVIKAIGMHSLSDILLCLTVSLAAFGLVIYVRSRKV
jgi:hypothetical protein